MSSNINPSAYYDLDIVAIEAYMEHDARPPHAVIFVFIDEDGEEGFLRLENIDPVSLTYRGQLKYEKAFDGSKTLTAAMWTLSPTARKRFATELDDFPHELYNNKYHYFTGEFFIYQFVLARAAAVEKENYAKQVAELASKIKTLWSDYKKASDSWYTAYKQKKSDIDQNGEFVNAECVEHECEMATMKLCSKYPPELARDAITAADLWGV